MRFLKLFAASWLGATPALALVTLGLAILLDPMDLFSSVRGQGVHVAAFLVASALFGTFFSLIFATVRSFVASTFIAALVSAVIAAAIFIGVDVKPTSMAVFKSLEVAFDSVIFLVTAIGAWISTSLLRNWHGA